MSTFPEERLAQLDVNLRCEWGRTGVRRLAPHSDAIVIVDVFSFTTSVDIATARGAVIYPCTWTADAAALAARVGADLAGQTPGGPSLKPHSLEHIEPGLRLVLPSPNGSTLTTMAGDTPTFAGCLRNAAAVAAAARACGPRISVIPGGERWPDDTLRPAIEDLVGAGAILGHLDGSASPEVAVAIAAYERAARDLRHALRHCQSGAEKADRGLHRDIEFAAMLDVSTGAPRLVDGAYRI